MIELRAVNLWYRSQHEEIDLISEEDFYLTAPETISRPVSVVVHVYMYTCILVACVSMCKAWFNNDAAATSVVSIMGKSIFSLFNSIPDVKFLTI